MTKNKRFFMSGYSIWDSQNDNQRVSSETAYKLLNELNDKNEQLEKENDELKEVIVEVFEMVTNLDYVREQYLNALLDVLGEENDVDKTKKRIKEFLE